MDLFDTLTFAEILVGTTFLGTPTLTVLYGSLQTTLPGLQALINKPTPPSIIAIQETKLTTSKSTKYLQRLFPHIK
jgi:hypothetical protein